MASGERVRAMRARIIWLDVILAGLAALGYALIALGILGVGDLAASERPAGIIVAAGGCYLLGGALILARRRWLWIVGAAINALVLLIFFLAYADRPAVLFSAGGIATKLAQLLLEVGLIALIVAGWPRGGRDDGPLPAGRRVPVGR